MHSFKQYDLSKRNKKEYLTMHMLIEEHQLSLKMHLLLPKRERLGFYMTDIKTP